MNSKMIMATDADTIVRRAYHAAEGNVMDVQGFIDLFAEDGVFNGIGGVSGKDSYRGEQLGDVVVWMGKLLPDVHRELHRVNVLGDVVAIELSIQGTFLGPFETPAGVIQPTGAKLDIPPPTSGMCATAVNDTWRETRCDGSQILKTTGGHEHEGSSLEDDHRLGRGRGPGSCYRRRAVAGCDSSRREHEGQRGLERERPVQAAAHRSPPDQA